MNLFKNSGQENHPGAGKNRPRVRADAGRFAPIFNIEGTVELRESYGMKVRELALAEELAEQNRSITTEEVE